MSTEPHALFSGNPELYLRDREWRKDIPKAGQDQETPTVSPIARPIESNYEAPEVKA